MYWYPAESSAQHEGWPSWAMHICLGISTKYIACVLCMLAFQIKIIRIIISSGHCTLTQQRNNKWLWSVFLFNILIFSLTFYLCVRLSTSRLYLFSLRIFFFCCCFFFWNSKEKQCYFFKGATVCQMCVCTCALCISTKSNSLKWKHLKRKLTNWTLKLCDCVHERNGKKLFFFFLHFFSLSSIYCHNWNNAVVADFKWPKWTQAKKRQ